MSTQPRLQPTRRTVLRTAAWTAPAVSIAVAAPAFAASVALNGTPLSVSIDRNQNTKTVVWVLSFKNTGSTTISNLQAVFTGVTSTTGLAVKTGTNTWSGTGTSTRTYTGTIAPGATVNFVATFARSDNATGTASVTLSVPGMTGSLITSASYN